jgi:hypothetical protein
VLNEERRDGAGGSPHGMPVSFTNLRPMSTSARFFLGGVLGGGDTSRAAGGLTLLAFGTTGTASGTDGTDGCDPALFGRVDGVEDSAAAGRLRARPRKPAT